MWNVRHNCGEPNDINTCTAKITYYRPTPLGEVVALNLGQITFLAARPMYCSLAFLCTAQFTLKPAN